MSISKKVKGWAKLLEDMEKQPASKEWLEKYGKKKKEMAKKMKDHEFRWTKLSEREEAVKRNKK